MPDDILQARTERVPREPAGAPDAVVPDSTVVGERNDAQGMVDAGDHLGRGVHGHARQPRRDDRDPGDPRGPAREPERSSVDRQCVHADVRGAAVDRCRPGRPVRAPAAVGDRHRDLHGGVRRGRAGTIDPRSRRRSGRPGCGRRDRDAVDADRPVCRCARAGRRGVALGIWGGISGLAVAFGPLVGGAVVSGHLLALDLLAQRPDRAAARAAHPAAARRDARARVQVRSAGPGPGQRRPRRDRVGSGPRQRGRLDLPADHRCLRRRRRAAGVASSRGSCAPSTRCSRCASSPTGPSRWPTSPACSCSSGCSARSSSSRSSSRSCRACRRFSPGCGSCRGRRCRCSSRRSPARSQTASAAIG